MRFKNIKNLNIFNIIISILLPWIPLLHVYKFISGVSLGYLILIILLLISIFANSKNDSSLSKMLIVYLIYSIMFIPMSLLFAKDVLVISIFNKIIKYSIIIVSLYYLIPKNVDKYYFLKSYKILVYIAAFAVFTQVGSYVIFGSSIEFKIPFLSYYNDFSDAKDFSEIMNETGRFTSLFLEPSHFTFFQIPYLALIMFQKEDVTFKKLLEILFISFSILICVSSTAIILLLILWGIFLVKYLIKTKLSFRKIVVFTFMIIMLISLAAIALTNERIYFAIFRLSDDYSSSSDVWYRLIAGAEYIDFNNIYLVLFGNGLGNIESKFMNGVFYAICTTGLFGNLFIFIWFFIGLKNGNGLNKVILIILFLINLIEPYMFTPSCIIYYALLQFTKGEKNEKCYIYNC